MRSLLFVVLLASLLCAAPVHAQTPTPPPPTPTETPLPTPTPVSSCPPGLDDLCNWVVAAQNAWGLPKFTWALVLVGVLLILGALGRGLLKRGESIGEKIPDNLRAVLSRRSAMRRYLKVFVQQNKVFGFRGMEMLALQPIELSRAYVQLDLFYETRKQPGKKAEREQKETGLVREAMGEHMDKKGLRLAQVLREGNRKLAIVGDAGSGKSALLQWVGLAAAHHLLGNGLSKAQKELIKAIKIDRIFRPLLPMIVPLRRYHAYCKEKNLPITPDSLYAFIGECPQRDYKKERLPDGLFCHLLKRGCLVMFDGVDEVDFSDRPAVRAAVEGIVDDDNCCKRNIYLITTRPSAADVTAQLGGFETAFVQPLTTEKRQELIELWCDAVYSTATEADAKAADLFRRIQDDLVRDMAGTPLMVNIFGLVYFHRRDLPSQRAELFEYAVLALLTDPHKQGQAVADSSLWGGRQLNQRRDDMALIAYILHDSGKDDIFAEELLQKELFWKRFGSNKEVALQAASEFLDLVARRGGLLRQDGQRYDFYIRRFREFLAGRFVAQKMENQWNKVIGKHIFDDQWEEPFQLAIGFLAFTNLEKAEKFMRLLVEMGKREDCHDRALTIAGLALGDVLKISDEQVKSVFARQRKSMPAEILKLFTKNPPITKPRLRQRLGLALGEIGDPRFVSTPAPGNPDVRIILPDMLPVPAGTFQMGTSKEEENFLKEQKADSYSDEKPAHSVCVSGFSIARFPVTNAEFALFVEQGGYDPQAEWWSADGRRWRTGEWDSDLSWLPDDKDLRRRYREWLDSRPVGKRSQPFFWDDPRWKAPGLPVVGVTWFEAEAYANWLKVLTGRPYRLPTEAEWEKAARGPENFLWPWGNRWEPERCNNAEPKDKIGGTSPVGMYPHGESPYHVQEMVGNVWEWCADWWQADIYQTRAGQEVKDPGGPDTGSARVLRGGSWYDNRDDARCAYRGGNAPVNFYDGIGFRLVLSPSSISAL